MTFQKLEHDHGQLAGAVWIVDRRLQLDHAFAHLGDDRHEPAAMLDRQGRIVDELIDQLGERGHSPLPQSVALCSAALIIRPSLACSCLASARSITVSMLPALSLMFSSIVSSPSSSTSVIGPFPTPLISIFSRISMTRTVPLRYLAGQVANHVVG